MESTSLKGRERQAPLAMDAERFRALGHSLIDQIASLLESIPHGPVTRDQSPSAVREALGLNGGLPAEGTDAATLLASTTKLAVRALAVQWSPALLRLHHVVAGADRNPWRPARVRLNPNVGAWPLSPAASEIEAQTFAGSRSSSAIRPTAADSSSAAATWPTSSASSPHVPRAPAGMFVATASPDRVGSSRCTRPPRRTRGFRRPPISPASARRRSAGFRRDDDLRMDVTQLERRIEADVADGHVPFIVDRDGRFSEHRSRRSIA